MKSAHATIVLLGLLLVSVPQQGFTLQVERPLPVKAVASQEDSPAQARIAAAQKQIEQDPKKLQAVNDLAVAYLRRARETADSKYYQNAFEVLSRGLRLDPNDFQLLKTQVAWMLGTHQFAAAKQKAMLLNHRTPDDVMTYGYLAEADIELGNYKEAERSAQWMLNMRPNNVPGLLLAARLRLLYGDSDGALQVLELAYSETSPAEVEELAWIANQIAMAEMGCGRVEPAAAILEQAEQLFPNYPYTLEAMARLRLRQHRPAEAVALLLQARQTDSRPEVLFFLAEAQRAAGHAAEALATEAEFEKRFLHPPNQTLETGPELTLLYARDPSKAPEALKLAQQAISSRHDVDTLDAFAWALYMNGRVKEANDQIQQAIAVGVQSAQIFNHAGHIAKALNRPADASRYFELSLRTDSSSDYAADTREGLGLPANVNPVRSQINEATTSLKAAEPSAQQPTRPAADIAAEPLRPASPAASPSFTPVPADLLTPRPTATGRLIHNAQASVSRTPKDAQAYASLGAAYFQQARETGDVSDYQLAEESLHRSLDLVSADFSAESALESMAEVCMGEHRFTDALTYSQKALALESGDVSPFAIVGDAYADMGEYDKAALAYARLTPREMTLSPRAAYARDSRISYLKFVSGDTAKAIELMKAAVAEGIEAQLPQENLAWLYYELGEYLTQAGEARSADAAYLAALGVHPGDYRALAGLAKLRSNNGRYAEAIVLYGKAIAVVPMPIFIAELGDLYARTGDQVNAKKQYQLVVYIGLLGHVNQVLHNRDLAIFYADHDMKLPEALELAQKEFEVRHDVYTWDALAWALYKNGKFAEAEKASEKALKFGTRDSLLLYHAGMIAERSGDRDRARSELTTALQINPHFHLIYAGVAQQKLHLMDTHAAYRPGWESHAR